MDDIILTAFSNALRNSIMSKLRSEFSRKDLGPMSYFLGNYVPKHTCSLFLSQRKYAEEIIKLAVMSPCKPTPILVDTKEKLNGSLGNPYHDRIEYQSLAEALIYLTFTRPNISYVVQPICLFMHDPKMKNMSALKRIIRYIHDTIDFDLHLYPFSVSILVSYTYVDWAGCPDTRQSTYGYCVYLGEKFNLTVFQTAIHRFSV